MASRRQQALEALVARVATIRRAAGFQTDAGATVFLGEVVDLGAQDPSEAIAVVPQDTQPGANRMETLPVEIQALAKADLDQPHLAIEAALADIAQAVETNDRTLGGLVKNMDLGTTRALPREPGSTTVGCGITYLVTYARVWGEP